MTISMHCSFYSSNFWSWIGLETLPSALSCSNKPQLLQQRALNCSSFCTVFVAKRMNNYLSLLIFLMIAGNNLMNGYRCSCFPLYCCSYCCRCYCGFLLVSHFLCSLPSGGSSPTFANSDLREIQWPFFGASHWAEWYGVCAVHHECHEGRDACARDWSDHGFFYFSLYFSSY